MQFASVLLLAGMASAAAIFERDAPTCDANDCARQVSATRFGAATQDARVADCTSFLQVTVTTTPGVPGTTVFPTAVPTYASSCTRGAAGGFSQYSSACVSCNGVAQPTTTVVAGCNRDQCLRGLFGDAISRSVYTAHTNDCSSFLATTVSQQFDGSSITITPSVVPAYATPSCTSQGGAGVSARFSSACVCAGVFPTTVTRGD